MRRIATASCVAGLLLTFSSAPAGAATLAPISADFGTQPVGGVSAPRGFTLTPELLDILPLTVATTGQFKQTNTCGAVLQFASGPCTISVTFAPTAVGNQFGSLTTTTLLGGPSASLRGTATTGSGADKGEVKCTAAGKKKKKKGKKKRATSAAKKKKKGKKKKGCKKKGKKKRKGKKK